MRMLTVCFFLAFYVSPPDSGSIHSSYCISPCYALSGVEVIVRSGEKQLEKMVN